MLAKDFFIKKLFKIIHDWNDIKNYKIGFTLSQNCSQI